MKHPKSNLNNNNNNIHSIDESESYFSYMLSPYTNNHDKVESAIKNGDKKKCEGDVDCEAEVFIRQKHRRLELSRTMSMIIE